MFTCLVPLQRHCKSCFPASAEIKYSKILALVLFPVFAIHGIITSFGGFNHIVTLKTTACRNKNDQLDAVLDMMWNLQLHMRHNGEQCNFLSFSRTLCGKGIINGWLTGSNSYCYCLWLLFYQQSKILKQQQSWEIVVQQITNGVHDCTQADMVAHKRLVDWPKGLLQFLNYANAEKLFCVENDEWNL